jgi:hypothetical protein
MSHRPRVLSAAAAAIALVGAAFLAAPPAAASSTASSITVFLRAPHMADLDRLAAAQGLTHAQRVAKLARLVPSDTARDTVTRSLLSDGLIVGSQTAWSITAHGPASAIASAFGRRPDAVAHPTAAEFRAETGALPLVPAALVPLVTAVFPTTGGPAVFHHSTATPLKGGNFRNAYTSAHTRPPGSGATVDGRATVATLQLANYAASDLTKYASKQRPRLPRIVGTSKYHKVTVDGGPTAADDQGQGDVEVDLDQESILSTAPSATQRPYFAPNTNAGFNDVFANAFDDVVQNSHDNGAGDPHITALSSSWGGCESGYGAKEIAAAQTVVKALVAAGVTVFASSGDDGIYDCGSAILGLSKPQADVDYPASSPQVVGVGGTNLQHTGKKAARNNGHNWHEKAWTCSSTATCVGPLLSIPVLPGGSGGSGGGESGSAYSAHTTDSFAGFAEPAYQRKTIHSRLFAHQKHRMVPDIAADGDPSTGFDVYSSDPSVAGDENSKGLVQVGGTSLSSPISAALFTNALAGAGKRTGVGNIHLALYEARRKGIKAFRDVTVGRNGAAADRGRDPSVSAHRGYDTVSGLGGVLWPALTAYLLKSTRGRHTSRSG